MHGLPRPRGTGGRRRRTGAFRLSAGERPGRDTRQEQAAPHRALDDGTAVQAGFGPIASRDLPARAWGIMEQDLHGRPRSRAGTAVHPQGRGGIPLRKTLGTSPAGSSQGSGSIRPPGRRHPDSKASMAKHGDPSVQTGCTNRSGPPGVPVDSTVPAALMGKERSGKRGEPVRCPRARARVHEVDWRRRPDDTTRTAERI